MSEHTHCNHDPNTPDELRMYTFIGSKLANMFLQNTSHGEQVDDQEQAVLTEVLATCLGSGIILGAQGTVDKDILAEHTTHLQEQVAAVESPALTALIPNLITRGVHFYKEQIAGEPSPQVQSWLAEFALLRSAETET